MKIELSERELNFLQVELDYRLKKCNPLGFPTTNSQIVPKEHAEFYNSFYKKLTNRDHPDYLKYKETLR